MAQRTSLVTDRFLRTLHTDASSYPLESYTTRFFEYLFQKVFFAGREWVVSSQQPPSLHSPSGRRVDLVVERFDSHSCVQPILFMEAKHNGAEQTAVREGHCQAWTAAEEYSINLPIAQRHPVWMVTCIGTTIRIDIYYPDQILPIQFLPGYFRLQDVEDDYLETDIYGKDIVDAFKYIIDHPIPPMKFLVSPIPSVSTIPVRSPPRPQSPQSAARQKLEGAAAAAKGQTPLDERKWIWVDIIGDDGTGLIGRSARGVNTFPRSWRAEHKEIEGQRTPCYTWIGPDRAVYWTFSLEPTGWEQGKGKAKAGPSNFSEASFRPEQQSYESSPAESGPSHIRVGDDDDNEAEEEEGGEEAAQPSKKKREWHKVDLSKQRHMIGHNTITFKDENGNKVPTHERDWKWRKHQGKWVFPLKKANKFYFTWQEP